MDEDKKVEMKPAEVTGSDPAKPAEPKDGIKYGKWSREEHKELLKALIKNGRNWNVIAKEMPHRTLLQIQVRTKLILGKLEKFIPKNADLNEFLKSKDLEWFETKDIASKFKFDNEDYDGKERTEEKCSSPHRSRSRNKAKGASNINLRSRQQLKSSQDNSDRQRNNNKKQGRPPHRDSGKFSDSGSEQQPSNNFSSSSAVNEFANKLSNCDNLDEAPSETRFSSAIRVLPSSVAPDSATSELYKIPPPPPTILPFSTIGDTLNKLIDDITGFGQRLENDYVQRVVQLDSDTELGEYWRGLRECSESLLHVVNDITLLHQHNEMTRKNFLMQELPMLPQRYYSVCYPESMQPKPSQYPGSMPSN